MSINHLPCVRVWVCFLLALATSWVLFPNVAAASGPVAVEMGRKQEPKQLDKHSVKFEMVNKPWGKVFEWLADEFEIPVITGFKIDDYFTFVGLLDAKYTLPEVITIINQTGLLPKGFILLRYERFIIVTVVPEPLLAHVKPCQSALERCRIATKQPGISRSTITTCLFPARLPYNDSVG